MKRRKERFKMKQVFNRGINRIRGHILKFMISQKSGENEESGNFLLTLRRKCAKINLINLKKLFIAANLIIANYLKDKSFASNLDQDAIKEGAESLGVSLDEHIEFVIKAMQSIADYRNERKRFGIKTEDRRRHIYIIGKT